MSYAGHYICTSTDGGYTWTEQTFSEALSWSSISSSSDGTKLAAAAQAGVVCALIECGRFEALQ